MASLNINEINQTNIDKPSLPCMSVVYLCCFLIYYVTAEIMSLHHQFQSKGEQIRNIQSKIQGITSFLFFGVII